MLHQWDELQQRVVFQVLVNLLQCHLHLFILNLVRQRILLFGSRFVKVRFEADTQVEAFGLQLHPIDHVFQLLLQVELGLLSFEGALLQGLPVLEVLERVDDQLALCLHQLQFLSQSRLVVVLLDKAELGAVFHLLATLDQVVKRQSDPVLESVVEHILQVVLGLDLLVQHSESHILNVSNVLKVVIIKQFLSDDIDQKLLLLFGVFFENLVVRYEFAFVVLEKHLVDLPVFKLAD